MDKIRITCRSSDGFSKTRSFKTWEGATKWAIACVGETPEISETFGYAVCKHGVNKIEASVPVNRLFPKIWPYHPEEGDWRYPDGRLNPLGQRWYGG